MGNEAAVPGAQQTKSSSSPSPTNRSTPEYELLIIVRGLRRTGKSTLLTRMKGRPFEADYKATPAMAACELPWISPDKERVNVTAWDVVEKALMPVDSEEAVQSADATTVDTFKRANGMIVMIDSRFNDTVALAERLVVRAPDELPLLIFNNFMDNDQSSPVIPERLQKYMGRFYYIPGSLRTNQGLVELSKWLTLPLMNAKIKIKYNALKAAEADFTQANIEFTTTAQNFVDAELAKEHMPKLIPVKTNVEAKQEVPEAVEEVVKPQVKAKEVQSTEAETKREEEPSKYPRQRERVVNQKVQPKPEKKVYRKPYRRRQSAAQKEDTTTKEPVNLKKAESPDKQHKSPDSDLDGPKQTNSSKKQEESDGNDYEPLQKEEQQLQEEPNEQSSIRPKSPEPVKQETKKLEPVKQETKKLEPVKQETKKLEPVKQETKKLEPIKSPSKESDLSDEDNGVFWSDDEDETPGQMITATSTLEDSDEDDWKPNPLVQGRAKSVDLFASIKQTEQEQEAKSKMTTVQSQQTIVVTAAPDSAEDNDSDDGYGTVDGSEEKPKLSAGKLLNRRRNSQH